MPRVRMLGSRVATLDIRTAKPPEKEALPFYSTPEFREWRERVVSNAGRRCEATPNGKRCWKAEPMHRMFADHIIEVSDGGALFDTANGQCLCGAHHTIKTNQAKAARAAQQGRA